ncbi:MAG TPA: FHA domain-containing protein [Candidatus Brocadiia bacterium]|nr:FHA domain-containing protein [Candidatus Brocadiia bacterium]
MEGSGNDQKKQPNRSQRDTAIDKAGRAGLFKRLKQAATGRPDEQQSCEGKLDAAPPEKPRPHANDEWRDIIGDIALPVEEPEAAHTLSEHAEPDNLHPPSEVIPSGKRVAELNANPPSGAIRLRPVGSHGVIITLSQQVELIVGRETEHCDIVVLDRRCSRKHCTLIQRGSRVVVRDLQSRNGVYVNAHKVEGSETAFVGDSIRIGHAKMIVSE